MPRRFGLDTLLVCIVCCMACDGSPRAESTKPSAAPPAVGAPARPNIILVSIDTLRADALSKAATPYLHALTQSGTRFTRAYSTAPWTAPALASLLTGTYPLRHGVRKGAEQNGVAVSQPAISAELPMLPEMLKRAGYRTFGLSANHHAGASFGFGRGFDHYECAGFWDGELVESFFQPIRRAIAEPSDAPFFLWLHVYDPHQPYRAREPWLSQNWPESAPRFNILSSTPNAKPMRAGPLSPTQLKYVKALYASEVSYTDHLLHRLLKTVDGGPENTALIVTSDHGEEFRDHGDFGHGHTLFDELIRVPMFIRAPGYAPGRDVGSIVSLVDILPTIAGLAGVSLPDGLPGRPLPRTHVANDPRTVFASADRGTSLRAVVHGPWKLVRDLGTGGARTAVYNLAADPRELRPLPTSPEGPHTMLSRSLDAHMQRAKQVAKPAPQAPLSKQQTERLRALGYIND